MKKLLLTLAILSLPFFALAQEPAKGGSTGINSTAGGSAGIDSSSGGSTGIFPSPGGSVGVPSSPGGSVGCTGSNCYSVNNPVKVTSFCGFIKTGFYALLPIVVAVGVVFIVWSGFMFVFAQGKPKDLQKARRNFYHVIIGLAIVLGAWVLAEAIAATINAIGGSAIISCN